MTHVDERGRVAGRVNLVDALAAIVILVLIPVAYGAYLLFRTPPAKLLSVNPTRLYQGRNLRIEISGQNLTWLFDAAFRSTAGPDGIREPGPTLLCRL